MIDKKMNITVMDGHAANPGDFTWSIFEEFGTVTVYERTPKELVVERAKGADIVFTNKVIFDDEVMAQLPELKYIGILATGTNVVDLKAAAHRGIIVTNIPAYSGSSVAQLVFAHILNVLNHVDRYADEVRAGAWSSNPDFCYWNSPLHELASMKLGVVGLGNIGGKVVRIARAMDMDVIAVTSKQQVELPEGVKKATMEEMLSTCDVISLHCPLTPETKELINKDTLAMMKPNAIVVNTGRGPLVNEQDVADALNEGRIAAYAADVMCQEPPSADNQLMKCKNAFFTPHLAWGTVEARQRLFDIALENVRAFVSGSPINVVR